MHEAIIIDTETTDVEDPQVIELAWWTTHLDGRQPSDGACYRFYPGKSISLGALATHHILLADLVGCLPSSRAAATVPQADYWIGHNVDFDWKALGSPPSVKRICTLALARHIWPECDSHSLTAMIYHLEGDNDDTRQKVRQAHGAQADIGMTASLLSFILVETGVGSFRELWELSEASRIPQIMTFGKYRGQPISAVDKGWVNWYLRQADTDTYLIEAFRRAKKL